MHLRSRFEEWCSVTAIDKHLCLILHLQGGKLSFRKAKESLDKAPLLQEGVPGRQGKNQRVNSVVGWGAGKHRTPAGRSFEAIGDKFRFLSEEKCSYKKLSVKCKAEGSVYGNQPGLIGRVRSEMQESKCRCKSSDMKEPQPPCPL